MTPHALAHTIAHPRFIADSQNPFEISFWRQPVLTLWCRKMRSENVQLRDQV